MLFTTFIENSKDAKEELFKFLSRVGISPFAGIALFVVFWLWVFVGCLPFRAFVTVGLINFDGPAWLSVLNVLAVAFVLGLVFLICSSIGFVGLTAWTKKRGWK